MDFHPIDAVKNHPLLFGGVLVGGLVILLVIRGSGGGAVAMSGQPAGNATDNTLGIAQMQTQAGLAAAGLAAASKSEEIQAQKDVALAQLDTVNTHDNIVATVQLSQIAQGANLSAQQISASRDTTLAQIGSQERVQVMGIQNSMITSTAMADALRALAGRTQ